MKAAALALALVTTVFCAGAAAGDLAWLEGRWHGGNADETWEATFTSDAGGVVLGTYKQAKRAGALTFVELQQFDLRHTPTLILFPNGGAPYRLAVKRLTPTLAEFEGDHAFPRHVAFSRDSGGGHTLTLTGTLDGRPFQERFPFVH